MNMEDDAGGFADSPSTPSTNIFDKESNSFSFHTDMLNAKDVSYLAPVFIGTPLSQGAMVVYDTGSDWLTIKACITEKHCNKKIDKDATVKKMGKEAFASGMKEMGEEDDEDVQLKKEQPEEDFEVISMFPNPEGQKVVDTDNNGDGKMKPLSNPKKE